jgi:hypothetical protein
MKRAIVALAVVLVGVTGCAGSSTGGVSAAVARQLKPFVSELRIAAGGSSIPAVTEKEQALVQEVESLISSGDLSNAKGVKIEDAAATLLNDFKKKYEPTPTPTPSSETPTPTETPTSPGPTVTITIPPTDTSTAEPTETATTKHHGHGNAFGHGKHGL